MRKIFVVLTAVAVLSMLLVACGGTTATPEQVIVKETVIVQAPTPEPLPEGVIQVRWYVGMGTGTDPVQLKAEIAVVDAFNKSDLAKAINLRMVLEVIPYDSAQGHPFDRDRGRRRPRHHRAGRLGRLERLQWAVAGHRPVYRGDQVRHFRVQPCSREHVRDLGRHGRPAVRGVPIDHLLQHQAVRRSRPELPARQLRRKVQDAGWHRSRMVVGHPRRGRQDCSPSMAPATNCERSGFNKDDIKQYGYTWQLRDHPNYWGSFWQAARCLPPMARPPRLPDAWVAAWKWTYDAIWGDQPFYGERRSGRQPRLRQWQPLQQRQGRHDRPAVLVHLLHGRCDDLGRCRHADLQRQGRRPRSTPTPSASGRAPSTRRKPSSC